jgi:hypothetical protein
MGGSEQGWRATLNGAGGRDEGTKRNQNIHGQNWRGIMPSFIRFVFAQTSIFSRKVAEFRSTHPND